MHVCVRVCVCVCVCEQRRLSLSMRMKVCVYARARACVCLSVGVCVNWRLGPGRECDLANQCGELLRGRIGAGCVGLPQSAVQGEPCVCVYMDISG